MVKKKKNNKVVCLGLRGDWEGTRELSETMVMIIVLIRSAYTRVLIFQNSNCT